MPKDEESRIIRNIYSLSNKLSKLTKNQYTEFKKQLKSPKNKITSENELSIEFSKLSILNNVLKEPSK